MKDVVIKLVDELIKNARIFNECHDSENYEDGNFYKGEVLGLLFAINAVDKNAHAKLNGRKAKIRGYNYGNIEVYGKKYHI